MPEGSYNNNVLAAVIKILGEISAFAKRNYQFSQSRLLNIWTTNFWHGGKHENMPPDFG